MTDVPPYDINETVEALEALYPGVIDQMEDQFTSHQFILLLAKKHQHEYIKALAAHLDRDNPFRDLHAQLAKRLQHFPKLIKLEEMQVSSKTIFGDRSNTVRWRKIPPRNR
jgi:hypothetical protein